MNYLPNSTWFLSPERFKHSYDHFEEFRNSLFKSALFKKIMWLICEELIHTWLISWVIKASRFFKKTIESVYITKTMQRVFKNIRVLIAEIKILSHLFRLISKSLFKLCKWLDIFFTRVARATQKPFIFLFFKKRNIQHHLDFYNM